MKTHAHLVKQTCVKMLTAMKTWKQHIYSQVSEKIKYDNIHAMKYYTADK